MPRTAQLYVPIIEPKPADREYGFDDWFGYGTPKTFKNALIANMLSKAANHGVFTQPGEYLLRYTCWGFRYKIYQGVRN